MSRALRYAPPVEERGLVLRPRLLARLQERFDRPLTGIVAAAGFGKTTLLAQAIRENELAQHGSDRWLTCQRDDVSLSFLVSGIFAAVGLSARVPQDPREAADAVAEGLWSAAPNHIALILDDAHHIPRNSPGGQFLAALVAALPRNGHLVLASRPPFPLATARLLASRDAVVLVEQDMQFQVDEVADFATSRGVPAELLSAVGGWPALAELTATVGPHAVTGYVWEELLSQLSSERRHALGVLVAVGGADPETTEALLGPSADLDTLLDGLPLVVRAPSGWRSLHGLWAAALQHQLDSGQVATARRTAGLVLARRKQFHEAMDLLMDAGAWDDARRLIVDVCEMCTPLVPPDVLEMWLHRLPQDARDCAEGLLLTAMVVEPTNPDTAATILNAAREISADASRVRYACLNALTQLAFWRSDRQQMKLLAHMIGEVVESGEVQATGWTDLLEALLTPRIEDARAALASPRLLLTAGATNPIQDWLHAHLVLLRLGDPEAAEPLARRAISHEVTTMRAVSVCSLIESFRLRGRLDDAAELLPTLLGDLNSAKVLTSPELVICAVVLLCVLGRHDEAQDVLRSSGPTLESSPVAWAPISRALAQCFLAASAGEADAGAALEQILRLGAVTNTSVLLVSASALPLLYVLAPQTRTVWDANPLPGIFADLAALSRALVDVRDRGSLDAAVNLTPTQRTLIRPTLPVAWAAELGLALRAAGDPDGMVLLEDVSSAARTTLREQLSVGHPVMARTARAVLRELPPLPTDELTVQVLGPMTLTRNGVAVAAPELRRERVRQLLGYLLSHDRPTRAAITADLWPDLDDTSAARNLRTTLAYLQNLLEPDRAQTDAPYFVRATGPGLRLVTGAPLTVDKVEFERAVAEAEQLERQGTPSAALVAYQRAVSLWNGDFLADVSSAEWLDWERDRARGKFLRAAVRAGNLLLAKGETDAALSAAQRALDSDRWSENAYQVMIAAHLASGDIGAARHAVRRCEDMVHDLGAELQPQTRALAQRAQL